MPTTICFTNFGLLIVGTCGGYWLLTNICVNTCWECWKFCQNTLTIVSWSLRWSSKGIGTFLPLFHIFCFVMKSYKFTCAAFSIYIEGGPNGGFGGFLSHHLALSEIPQERCGRRIAEPEQTGSVAAQGCGCFFYGWWFYIFMICVPDLDDDPKQRSKFDWGEIAQFSKFRSYREGFKDIWNGFEYSVVWFCFSLENPWKTTWTQNHGTVQTKCIQRLTKIYMMYTMCCLKVTHNSSLLFSDV